MCSSVTPCQVPAHLALRFASCASAIAKEVGAALELVCAALSLALAENVQPFPVRTPSANDCKPGCAGSTDCIVAGLSALHAPTTWAFARPEVASVAPQLTPTLMKPCASAIGPSGSDVVSGVSTGATVSRITFCVLVGERLPCGSRSWTLIDL